MYPPTVAIAKIIVKRYINSILIIFLICFFSKPKILYSAKVLFFLFNKTDTLYKTKITAKIPTMTIPILIILIKNLCRCIT
ncbi:Uncharacterised protein [Chlamydia trachomatis]|nr:Uncharacterised protein [Chlamydia trachomatis]